MPDNHDVIIVGAGFAGLTAARELRFRGLNPIILEARDRVGGRTFLGELGGQMVEMGGQSVHWYHAHVWAELTRYGIGVNENQAWDSFVFWQDGVPTKCTRAEAGLRLHRLFAQFFEGIGDAITQPYSPGLNRTRMEQLDRMTIADRLEQMELSADDRDWLQSFLAAISGWPVERAGIWVLIRMWALGGWNLVRMLEMMGRFSIKGGTASLYQAIADDAQASIHLSDPVATIKDKGEAVTVTTRSGASYTAPYCVVATPVNLWPHIDFAPALSAGKRTASSEGVSAPAFNKIWVLAKGEVEHVFAVYPASRAITQLRVDRTRPDGLTTIVAFSVDPTMDPDDHEAIAAAVHEVLPGIEIVDIATKSWHGDDWARGAFNWEQPGQFSKYHEELRRPEGRLYFTTSDIAEGPGGIDGAIESALETTRAILARIKAAG